MTKKSVAHLTEVAGNIQKLLKNEKEIRIASEKRLASLSKIFTELQLDATVVKKQVVALEASTQTEIGNLQMLLANLNKVVQDKASIVSGSYEEIRAALTSLV